MASNVKLTDSEGNELVIPIRNNPVLQGIVEFNSAVRQGSPGRDDRNLASFIVYEDARGGIGQRKAEIREDLDKIYHSGGVDFRRFQEATKPPAWVFREVSANWRYLGGASVRHATSAVLLKADLNDHGESVEDDDLIFAWVHHRLGSVTPPAGWTTHSTAHPAGEGLISTFYKVASGEGASWTFGGTDLQVTAIAIRGADTGDPINASSVQSAFPAATTQTHPGVTTDEAGTFLAAYIQSYGADGISGSADTLLRFYDSSPNLIGGTGYESPGVQVRSKNLDDAGASGSVTAFHFEFETQVDGSVVNNGSPNRTLFLVAFNAAGVAESEDEAVMLESSYDGTMRLYVAHHGNVYQTDGVTSELEFVAEVDAGEHIVSMLEYELPVLGAGSALAAGTRLMLFAVAPSTTYVTQADGSFSGFSTHANIGGQGLFLFDGKAYAMGQNTLHWSIDPEDDWTNVQGNWPSEWRFIGVFSYGQTFMPYVLLHPNDGARAQVAVLELENNTLIPLQLGLTGIKAARAVAGEIAIVHNNGADIGIYNPETGGSFRDLDLQARERHGHGSVVYLRAVDVAPHPEGLLAAINTDIGGGIPVIGHLWLFKETGWMPIAPFPTDRDASAGYTLIRGMKWVPHLQRVILFGRYAGGLELTLLDFPWRDEPYSPGMDFSQPVHADDSIFILPWTDAGFAELDGALLAVRCGGYFNENLTIRVDYQLNGVESGGWTTLGTFPNTPPAEPEITGRGDSIEDTDVLLFGGSPQGVAFRSFRLRVWLSHTKDPAGDPLEPYQSPNAFPLIVQFIKRPALRDQMRFEVDTTRGPLRNGQIISIEQLMTSIRRYYNHATVLRVDWANQVTYAFITSFPRVFTLGRGSVAAGQVNEVGDTVSGVSTVITLAEPL